MILLSSSDADRPVLKIAISKVVFRKLVSRMFLLDTPRIFSRPCFPLDRKYLVRCGSRWAQFYRHTELYMCKGKGVLGWRHTQASCKLYWQQFPFVEIHVDEFLISTAQVKSLTNLGEAMCYEPGNSFCEVWPRPALSSWYTVSGGFIRQTSVSIFEGSLRIFLERTKKLCLGFIPSS